MGGMNEDDTSNAMNERTGYTPYYADPKDESLRTPLRSRDIKSTLRIYIK